VCCNSISHLLEGIAIAVGIGWQFVLGL
jgi:hypothetical protein